MWLLLLLAACLPTTQDETPITITDLVDPETEAIKIAKSLGYTDGPSWHPDGYMYVADRRASKIYMLEPNGEGEMYTNTVLFEDIGGPQGMVFDSVGNLYFCQQDFRQVMAVYADGRQEWLADKFEGRKLNSPDDLTLDGQGGLYFTDPRYGPMHDLEQDVMSVYYLAPSGVVTRVETGMEKPNGIAISPDGSRLYVAEPNKSRLYGFEVKEPGRVGRRELLFEGTRYDKDGLEVHGSGPDGLAVDELGNIYACFAQIVVVRPEGGVIGEIHIPERTANCTFGGPEGRTLFVTARNSIYSVQMKVAGAPLLDPLIRPERKTARPEEAAEEKKND
jgi:sugar lactone lactonase YvrE